MEIIQLCKNQATNKIKSRYKQTKKKKYLAVIGHSPALAEVSIRSMLQAQVCSSVYTLDVYFLL